MKKQCYFLVALVLGLFSAVSSASTVSFYASKYTSGPKMGTEKDDPTYLTNTSYQKLFAPTTSGAVPFSIAYTIESTWNITSAFLRLKAVDDNNYGFHCGNSCPDGKTMGSVDLAEKAVIKDIEGITGTYATVAVNSYGWYDLGLNVTAYLTDGILNGKVAADWADGITPPTTTKTVCSGHGRNRSCNTVTVPSTEKPDLWYKNAELVINYDLKPVPVPAAVWLFGSALLGLTGMKRKSIAVTA
jgi:hypothetical protein